MHKNQEDEVFKKERKFLQARKFWVILGIVLVVFFGGFLYSLFFSGSSVVKFVLSKAGMNNEIKSTDGRVNILLLGLAGGNHDGALLTDSIIVASYNLKTKRVVLISIPRDLWLEGIKEKVNAAYEIGQAQGKGLGFAEDKIDDILGVPVHYGVRIDFSGFSKAIDLVGGVDVDVLRTFDDYQYPITGKENDLCGYTQKQINTATGSAQVYVDVNGQTQTNEDVVFSCRFEHIHFNKGITHLDGETALKFVRSRHGLNGEGSDFARSRRQQIVLSAFRSKVLSVQTLTNPQKLFALFDTFGKSFETDIPNDKYLDFFNMIKDVKQTDNYVLGDLGNGQSLFINPPVSQYGAWVLIPPDGNWDSVANFVRGVLNGQMVNPNPSASGRPTKVIVQ